ncbi:MAG TPA: hypothetical protein VME44_28420 [Streptosporangiaceae bacterium]|nr:hypothetical protein [Streptosporangiaceae bacterium]
MNQAGHPADTPPPGDDAAHWRDAARLRAEHSGWVIVWLARTGQFRAYKRLPGARRDTSLTAATADALATKITAAEQAATRPTRRAQETR